MARKKTPLVSVLAMAPAFLIGSVAVAQTPASTRDAGSAKESAELLEEITVTAQRRAENIHDVPIAVTNLGANDLQSRGVSNLVGLTSLVPSLNISPQFGSVNVYLRGVGTSLLGAGSDSSVAFYEDGVYIASSRVQASSFFDVDRVEVLRGPQGDLYGRNSTGGALQVITRKPTDTLDGFVRATGGSYGRAEVEGGLGGPIAGEQLTGRVSFVSLNHQGFGRNEISGRSINDRHEDGARLQLRYAPSDRFDVLLAGEYYRAKDANGGFSQDGAALSTAPLTGLLFGGRERVDERDIVSELDPTHRLEIYGASLSARWQITERLDFRAISGYRDSESALLNLDVDDTNIAIGSPLSDTEKSKTFSQEAQLQWQNDVFNLLGGAYYFHSEVFNDNSIGLPVLALFGLPPQFNNYLGTVTTNAIAGFVHGEAKVTDQLTLIVGGRYSRETRHSLGTHYAPGGPIGQLILPVDYDRTWSAFTPRGTVQYAFTPDMNVYATVARGFKSGIMLAGSSNPPVDPEYVTSYEIGVKSELFGRHLAVNFAAFDTEYRDLQTHKIQGLSGDVVVNAGRARIRGAEVEVTSRLGAGFSVTGSASYLDASIREFINQDPVRPDLGDQNLKGNTLPFAPAWSGDVRISKRIDLANGSDLVAEASSRLQSRIYFDAYNQSYGTEEGYSIENANLTWNNASGDLSISGWVRNISDETSKTFSFVSSVFFGYPQNTSLTEPRTFGADVVYRF